MVISLQSGQPSFLVCFIPFLFWASVSRSVHRQYLWLIQPAVLLSWLTAAMLLYKKQPDAYIKPTRPASATENNSEALCSMRFHFKRMDSSTRPCLGHWELIWTFLPVPIFYSKSTFTKENKNKRLYFQFSESSKSWTNKHWKGVKD